MPHNWTYIDKEQNILILAAVLEEKMNQLTWWMWRKGKPTFVLAQVSNLKRAFEKKYINSPQTSAPPGVNSQQKHKLTYWMTQQLHVIHHIHHTEWGGVFSNTQQPLKANRRHMSTVVKTLNTVSEALWIPKIHAHTHAQINKSAHV